jgi:UDP-N-acetylglucosamine 2-epimerase (non-hydrolysing)
MTDSGGIQEETTALQVPCVTIRTTTERPSTVDIGTNILIDPNYDTMISTVLPIVDGKIKQGAIPPKWDGNASERVVEIVTTFLQN